MTADGVCTGRHWSSVFFFSALISQCQRRHIEGRSTVFGSMCASHPSGTAVGTGLTTLALAALNYATMRLLGVDAEEPFMQRARSTLHQLGKR